jgi:tetratricopeptide (TPR) repeat protein
MRAFVRGKQAMRRSDYEEAVPHFRRAVEADPSFALAWHGLQSAYAMTGGWEESAEPGRQAARHAAQLPERERLIVEASSAYYGPGARVTESLLGRVEDAVRRRPDDWELLEVLSGMQLFAFGSGISPRTADSVRGLAAVLAPDNAALLTRIDLALGFYRDSALALSRIEQREEVTGRRLEGFRLVFHLVFARDEGPGEAARLAATPDDDFTGYPFPLAHPLSTPARIRVNRAIADRKVEWKPLEPIFFTAVTQGRLDEALAAAVVPNTRNAARSLACHAYLLHMSGVEVEGSEAARWLTAPTDDAGSEAAAEAMLCLGGLAVDERRWEDAEAWLYQIRATAPADDSIAVRTGGAAAAALEAYLGWERGTSSGPIPRTVRLDADAVARWPIRWWTAHMLTEAGRGEEALEVYESFWLPAWVPAFLRRAELSEELGRTAEARELYTVVTTVWADADPAFAPLLERARAGLARLDELDQAATTAAPPVTNEG